jgi:hypothetical protein
MASGVGVVIVVAGEGVRGRIQQRASNSRRRRMEEGGVGTNMRLIREEGYSLNIKSRHNFVVVIHISLFININSYLCIVRHVRATHVRFTIGVSNSFIIT